MNTRKQAGYRQRRPSTVAPARSSLVIAAILALGSAFAQFGPTEPIKAEVNLRESPTTTRPLVVAVQFDIPDGIHVYRGEDHFFRIQDVHVQNLGAMRIEYPSTRQIPDVLADEPGATIEVFEGKVSIVIRRKLTESQSATSWAFQGTLRYQGCTETTCFPPEEVPFSFAGIVDDAAGTASAGPARDTTSAATMGPSSAGKPDDSWGGKGWFLGTILAFLAGLMLSLTPCVYPMVGITVAVIGANQASRRRTVWLTFLYVLGLSIVYALVGVVVALLGSPAAAFLRSAWVLVPIGVIFLVLGLSMFDLFTIQTPSALAGRLQQMGEGGTAAGVFVMGALSAFVVGPCVSGPLLGLITYVATTGKVVIGFLYFFALAWGMGAILFVAGSASGALPRAGMWMETVKHVLGMVLIWGAFYFTRPVVGETVFAAASLTCLFAGLGILGLLQLPQPGTGRKGLCRLVAGVAVGFLVCYLYVASTSDSGGTHGTAPTGKVDVAAEVAKGAPVILDFWAPWCTICKKIDRTVLSRADIREALAAYNMVRVDYDTNKALAKRYKVIGPPAFIFLDAGGQQDGETVVTGEKLTERLRPQPTATP